MSANSVNFFSRLPDALTAYKIMDFLPVEEVNLNKLISKEANRIISTSKKSLSPEEGQKVKAQVQNMTNRLHLDGCPYSYEAGLDSEAVWVESTLYFDKDGTYKNFSWSNDFSEEEPRPIDGLISVRSTVYYCGDIDGDPENLDFKGLELKPVHETYPEDFSSKKFELLMKGIEVHSLAMLRDTTPFGFVAF